MREVTARVQKFRTILDRDDPIADERYNRDSYWRGVQQQAERAKTTAAESKAFCGDSRLTANVCSGEMYRH